jgi:hypothetical protein
VLRTASDSWAEECRFWLPASDRVSYGTLSYSPDRGPTAHLLDSELGDGHRLETPEHVTALHGESLGGTPFSLLDAWVIGGRRFVGEEKTGNTVDVVASALVRRAHIVSLAGLRFDAAGLTARGLLECVTGGKVDGSRLFEVAPTTKAHEELSVPLDGATVTISVWTSEQFGRHETSTVLGANASFKLENGLDLGEFDENYADPLRDLITFATREPSWIETLTVRRPGHDESDPWSRIGAEVEIVRPPASEQPVQTSRSYYALALNLGTFARPSDVIVAWFRIRRQLGPVWPLLFGTLERPSLPLENQLLNLTAFVEGYHRTLHDDPPLSKEVHTSAVEAMLGVLPESRFQGIYEPALRFANSQTQRMRARWMAERAVAALPRWNLDIDEFVGALIDTRNWLTHWGQRGRRVQEAGGMALLCRRLELVIRVNLMRDLGLTSEEIDIQVAGGYRLEDLP